eukprot:3693114-Amphidinium_carterae.2
MALVVVFCFSEQGGCAHTNTTETSITPPFVVRSFMCVCARGGRVVAIQDKCSEGTDLKAMLMMWVQKSQPRPHDQQIEPPTNLPTLDIVDGIVCSTLPMILLVVSAMWVGDTCHDQ